jgi:hypothetical protein
VALSKPIKMKKNYTGKEGWVHLRKFLPPSQNGHNVTFTEALNTLKFRELIGVSSDYEFAPHQTHKDMIEVIYRKKKETT